MLKVLHDLTHSRKSNELSVRRFQIHKPGMYSRLVVSASADAAGWSRAGTLDLVMVIDASRLEVIAHRVYVPLNQEPLLIDLSGSQLIRYFAFAPARSARSGFAQIRLKLWGEEVERRILAEMPLIANGGGMAVPIQGRFLLDRIRFKVEEAFINGWIGIYTTTGQPLYESPTSAAWATAGIEVVSTINREFDAPTFFLVSSSSGRGRVRVIFEGY